jgi:periplasmic nitrate reductase NapE
MSDKAPAPEVGASTSGDGGRRKTEEFRTWLFLSFVMAPILSVLIVSGYGFVVWMYQLFAGPPGS